MDRARDRAGAGSAPRTEIKHDAHLDEKRLHIVTGKGGTGKTTVAAALALMLARDGARILLVEVEGRQGLSQVFGVSPLDYRERVLAETESGGAVFGLSIEPEEALLDYLEKFYGLRRAGSALRKLGAVDFATTIAPGLRDVLLTGKISEAVRRTESGRAYYDAVVVDAPPTGRIGRFLNVTAQVADIAKVGPINAQAELVIGVVRNHKTSVHVVSTLEEMPTQETRDAVEELRELGLNLGAIFVSMTREEHIDPADRDALLDDDVDDSVVMESLVAGGLPATLPAHEIALGLIDEGADYSQRVAVESQEYDQLHEIGLPLINIPLIPTGIDVAALRDLAQVIDEQVGHGHSTP